MYQNSQWDKLISNSKIYPEALENTTKRLELKVKKAQLRKWKLTCISSAAVFLLFILLVNTSTVFAKEVYDIPVIGALARFVNYNKSLSDAIHNDYVEEVNLSASNKDKTLHLPYIIADENNLVLFFQIPKDIKIKDNDWITVSPLKMMNAETGELVNGYSAATIAFSAENIKEYDGLTYIHYHFTEGEIPETIDLSVDFYIEHLGNTTTTPDAKGKNPSIDSMVQLDNQTEINTRENFGIFNFHLSIDKDAFRPPITYEIHKEQVVNGQKFFVEEVTIYPTGTEVLVTFEDDNTAWIKGIALEIYNENQDVLRTAGIMGGSQDTAGKWMNIYVESDYFNQSDEKYLSISGISLMPKDQEYVTVNLNNKTISPQIDGINLTDIVNNGKEAHLTFDITSADSLTSISMFDFEYEDTAGNIYQMANQGSTSVENKVMQNMFTVKYPEDGIIILKRVMSPEVKLKNPIIIPLNP